MRRIVRCCIVCVKIFLQSIMNKEKLLKKFGAQVKLKRIELKITQEELAFKCEFDRTYISLIERGLRNISLSNLSILAEGLNTTISSLTKELQWH
jgi:transcriptional regulator with XRE-family HTH domain